MRSRVIGGEFELCSIPEGGFNQMDTYNITMHLEELHYIRYLKV